jgi:fibronectin-binding autotransporter adhesin
MVNGTIYVTGDNSVEFNTTGNGTINQNYSVNTGSGGRLEVLTNGAAGTVTIGANKSITGNGEVVNAVTIATGGLINPGNSAGVLETGNLSLQGTFLAELFGTSAINQYDQIEVHGSLDVSGGNLSLALNFIPLAGTKIFLIVNDGLDGVLGNFSNYAWGNITVTSTVDSNPYMLTLANDGNYEAGQATSGGNDVVLYMPIPEPTAGLLLLAGLGAIAARRRRSIG